MAPKLLGVGKKDKSLPGLKVSAPKRMEIIARALAARMTVGDYVRARALGEECAPLDDLIRCMKYAEAHTSKEFGPRMAPTRVSVVQDREIRRLAKVAGLKVATYMTRRALGDPCAPASGPALAAAS